MTDRKSGSENGNAAEAISRWTAKRKAAAVVDLLKGKTTPAEIARQHDLTVAEVEQWLATFTSAGEEALRANPRELTEQFAAERKELHAKIGQLTLEIDAAKKQFGGLLKDARDESL